MTTLLRIGQRVINLDQVTYIDDKLISITVWFGPQDSVPFAGEEAATLHAWLKQHATAAAVAASPISVEAPKREADQMLGIPLGSVEVPKPPHVERVTNRTPKIVEPPLGELVSPSRFVRGTLGDET